MGINQLTSSFHFFPSLHQIVFLLLQFLYLFVFWSKDVLLRLYFITIQLFTESSSEQLPNTNWQLLIPNAWNQLGIIYPLNLSQDNRWQYKWLWSCLSFNCMTMFEWTLIPKHLIEYFCEIETDICPPQSIYRENINSILQRTDIFKEMHFKSHFLLLIIWNFFQN